MTLDHFSAPLRLAAALGLSVGLSACAMLPGQDDRAPVAPVKQAEAPAPDTPVTPPEAAPVAAPQPPAAPTSPGSTVAELQSLIQAREVAELRTSYNGTYGASLLFKADDLTYYATLFQQKNFWRVVRTQSAQQADAAYQAFVRQSAELAEVELRRIRLEADNEHNARMLSRRSEQLQQLEANQSIRAQQEQAVAQRQAEGRAQAAELAKQRDDARRELRDLQKRIDALEAEQAKVTSGTRKR